MFSASRVFSPALMLCTILILPGCGSSGSGSGGGETPPAANPFSIDSYTEYKDGESLTGIWMMVINTEYDVDTAEGTRRASESFRSTVFMKENNSGSYSRLEVSDPFCAPPTSSHYADYVGNTVRISTTNTDFELAVVDYSRMSGSLEFHPYGCGLGGICIADDNTDTTVEMVKVAALPIGNWVDNFIYAAPGIGSISGVVQSDATSDAFEFDDEIDCFTHSKGTGGTRFMASVMWGSTVAPDYESIVVSTNSGDTILATRADDVLHYEALRTPDYYYPGYLHLLFSQATKNFDMSVNGANPVTINISADATSDASSDDASADGAELDIDIGF